VIGVMLAAEGVDHGIVLTQCEHSADAVACQWVRVLHSLKLDGDATIGVTTGLYDQDDPLQQYGEAFVSEWRHDINMRVAAQTGAN
jgi:hypothetical protein